MIFHHGTDLESAKALLSARPLDAARGAALKIDGPPGFFLATDLADAEFFALRQLRGPGAVLLFDISATALSSLSARGAVRRPVPRGPRSPRFGGDELHVPPDAFELFNDLCRSGEIVISAAP